jgi:hypothetical protein
MSTLLSPCDSANAWGSVGAFQKDSRPLFLIYFIELETPSVPNNRQFDVRIQNILVLDNYSVHTEVGESVGVVKSFYVDLATGVSTIDVDLIGNSIDRPGIAALEVVENWCLIGIG